MAGQAQVGALRVNLDLNSADFTQGMQSINRQLRGLNSEMSAARAANEDFDTSLSGMRQRSEILTRTFQAQRTRVSQLGQEYHRLAQAHGENSAEAQNMLVRYNNAQATMDRTSRTLEGLNRRITDAEDHWLQLSNRVGEAGERMQEVGGRMKDVGSGMTAGVTAPLVGLGVAALKTASDFDSSAGKIQAQLGLTAAEAKELNGTATNLWKQGFGESIDEVAGNLATVSKNMTEIDPSKLEDTAKAALSVSEAFDLDMNEVTRSANQLMKDFGMTSEEAFDSIAKGMQSNLNKNGDFLDTLQEYSPQFKALRFSGSEFFNTLQAGADAGAFSMDKVGDAVKEFNIRAKDGSEGTAEAFTALGFNAGEMSKKLAGGGKGAQEAFKQVVGELGKIEDPIKRNTIGVQLFGTQFEDLESDVVTALGTTTGEFDNVKGAADNARKAVEKTFSEKLQVTLRKAQAALLPLGEVLLDMADAVLPKVESIITKVSDKFEGMSPVSQQLAVVFGLIGAAIGPLLIVIGTIVSAIGSIVTAVAPTIAVLGKLKSAFSAIRLGMLAFTGPVGLIVGGLALIGIAAVKVTKEMKKPAIEVEGFGDKVSKSTQKAVQGYLDLESKAKVSMIGIGVVTASEVEKITANHQKMTDTILAEMDKQHAKQLEKTTKYFADSNALTQAEEAAIIEKQTKNNEAQAQAITDGQVRIEQILTNAKNNKRGITEAEEKEIAAIQDRMKTTAVVTMSKSETEQKVILERLKTESGKITALQAAEAVANSVKQKDGAVKEANDQYNKTMAEIIRMRDESGIITTQQADKMIAEAQKQRDGSITKAKETHTEVVKEAKAQAGEHVAEVDWTTGQVKSKWDMMKTDVVAKATEMKNNAVLKFKDLKTDVEGIINGLKTFFTKTIPEIVNFVIRSIGNMVVDVSKKWDEVKRKTESIYNGIKSFLMTLWENTKKEITNRVNAIRTNIETAFNNAKSKVESTINTLKTNLMNAFTSIRTEITNRVNNVKDNIIGAFNTAKTKVETLVGNIKSSTKKLWDDIVGGAKALPKRISDGISAMAGGVITGVNSMVNKLVSGIGKGLNGAIDGLNWVLGKINVKKIDSWKIPKYAKGTHSHAGGLAMVNDGAGSNYQELIHTPDGKIGMASGRNQILNLPKGTSVLSGDKTSKLLSSIPKYEDGIGDFFSFLDKPKDLLDKLYTKYVPKIDLKGTYGDIAKGGLSHVKDKSLDFIKEKLASVFVGDGFTGEMEKDPHKVGRGAGMGGMMKYVEYWYNQVKERFGKTHFMGGFADRGIVGNASVKSMHAYGRAFDIGGSHSTMSQIAEFLRKSAQNIQYVIYNRKISSAGGGWRAYTGRNPHTDHVHADFKASSPVISGGGGSAGNGTFPILGGVKDSATGGGGGYGYGPIRAKGWLAKSLAATGKSQDFLDELMTVAYYESKYNRDWINNWDSNADKGQPSQGLMHTIPDTFRSNALSGYGNILNPVHNGIAAIRYLDKRYGGIAKHPGLKSIARGGSYKPYANGGIVTSPHLGLVGEAGDEGIIPLSLSKRGIALDLWEKVGNIIGAFKVPSFNNIPSFGGGNIPSSNNSNTQNINVTLNYSGSASEADVNQMLDLIENGLSKRTNIRMMMQGV